MSLILGGTQPTAVEIKTYGFGPMGQTVYLGDYEIPLGSFLEAAEYVLINTDLSPDDPRLQFVKRVKSMQEAEGYNPGRKRLEVSDPAPSRS